MHAIAFSIFGLLLISLASAIPAPSPRVYSATIKNEQRVPIRCTIEWTGVYGPLEEADVITIDSRQEKIIAERIIDMGSWTASAYIANIQCGSLVLSHPFPGVSSITKNWIFSVSKTGISSVGQGAIED